jgi:hypothetical protein
MVAACWLNACESPRPSPDGDPVETPDAVPGPHRAGWIVLKSSPLLVALDLVGTTNPTRDVASRLASRFDFVRHAPLRRQRQLADARGG